MKIGDLVICRGELYGIILGLDDEDLTDEGYMWVQIMWTDSRITWEDMVTDGKLDEIFQVISLDSCKIPP